MMTLLETLIFAVVYLAVVLTIGNMLRFNRLDKDEWEE